MIARKTKDGPEENSETFVLLAAIDALHLFADRAKRIKEIYLPIEKK